MVKVAGKDATGSVARVVCKGIVLPLLPRDWPDRNRTWKAIRPDALVMGLPVGLVRLTASRENMAAV